MPPDQGSCSDSNVGLASSSTYSSLSSAVQHALVSLDAVQSPAAPAAPAFQVCNPTSTTMLLSKCTPRNALAKPVCDLSVQLPSRVMAMLLAVPVIMLSSTGCLLHAVELHILPLTSGGKGVRRACAR